MTSPFYTSSELVDASGLCLRSIHNHARRGWLKGTRTSLRVGWRFPAPDVQVWADFYLKPAVKRRLLEELDKPPRPKWCRSKSRDALHFVFEGLSPQGDCPVRSVRPPIHWQLASESDLSSRQRCAACEAAEKFWQEHGRVP